jgi:hypothetical protein
VDSAGFPVGEGRGHQAGRRGARRKRGYPERPGHQEVAGEAEEAAGEAEGDDDEDDVEAAVPSNRTKPWTRVTTANGFEAPELEGYTLAYTRSRTKVAIYRANDKSGWLVLDTRDGSQTVHENTTEARLHTNRLTDAFNTEQAKARADEKEAKAKERAEAKAKREQEKAEKEAEKKEKEESSSAA